MGIDPSAFNGANAPHEGGPTEVQAAGRSRGTLARVSLLSMAALIVLGATRVVYGSMVSRVTDHETYAVIGLLTAVTMIASFLLPAGIATAISRYVPFHQGRGELVRSRRIYRSLSAVGLLAAVLLSVSAGGIAWFGFQRPSGQVLEVALLTLFYALYVTHKAALYGFERVNRYVRLEILSSVVTLTSTAVVIATGQTLYLMPLVLGYVVFVAGAGQTLRPVTRGALDPITVVDRREIAGFVALACVGIVASAGFLQATLLLAMRFATATDVAYFTAAITLITPLFLLPRALGLALFPLMSRAHGAGAVPVVRSHADVSTRALLVLLAPAFVAGLLLSPELLTIFGGPTYTAGAPTLQIMLAAAYLAVIQVPSVNALSSGAGWQLRTPVGLAVAGTSAGLVAVVVLGEPLGALGVGLAYLLGTAITATGSIFVVWRQYAMPWARSFARALLAVMAAAAVAYTAAPPTLLPLEPWLADLALAAVGSLLAFAFLRRDIRAVLRSAWRDREPSTADEPPVAAEQVGTLALALGRRPPAGRDSS